MGRAELISRQDDACSTKSVKYEFCERDKLKILNSRPLTPHHSTQMFQIHVGLSVRQLCGEY